MPSYTFVNTDEKSKITIGIHMLQTRILPSAENAHAAPLLIKSLLLSGVRYESSREIVYRDQLRYSYTTFVERIARLANVLTQM